MAEIQHSQHIEWIESESERISRIIGTNLRRFRIKRGFSLERLSTASHVSRAMLSHIERGQSSPSVKTLWKILKTLDVSFEVLLKEPTTPATNPGRTL